MMCVTFLGVRGSFPCPSPINRRYGGNTAAVALHVDGEAPIFLDLGTGLLQFDAKEGRADARPFQRVGAGHPPPPRPCSRPALLPPGARRGTELDVYGPRQSRGSLRDAFAVLIDPPFFPVPLDRIMGDIRFHEVCNDEFAIGGATVTVRPVPHLGPTVGYRIHWDGGTLAYVSDHQAPPGFDHVDEAVLELCDGADLLIHEGQYTPQEFATKANWGHSTIDYAVRVASEAGARRLCLFHHDPWRSDDDLDALVTQAKKALSGATEEVVAAAEGMTLTVAGR